MERRLCHRYSVELEAIVSYPAIGLIHARILNLGPDGLYIDTGKASLDMGSCVELVLIGVGRSRHIFRFNATVVFTNDKGAGMLFSKENALNNQEMIKLLLLSEIENKAINDDEATYELKNNDIT